MAQGPPALESLECRSEGLKRRGVLASDARRTVENFRVPGPLGGRTRKELVRGCPRWPVNSRVLVVFREAPGNTRNRRRRFASPFWPCCFPLQPMLMVLKRLEDVVPEACFSSLECIHCCTRTQRPEFYGLSGKFEWLPSRISLRVL